jgi:DNA-binding PadR family transcriptional regulator
MVDIVRCWEIALTNPDRSLDAGLLVLMSLATGPKHGYAIIKDVEEFADSRMGPGTLYAAIERLEKSDLIAPIASRDRRKPYRLTPSGFDALRAQTDTLKRLANVATRRLATR